ncbi:MAG: hypothetical protein WCV99_00275 [Sterolibacterium sp.]|jgi:hypothetical protein
MTEIVRPNPVDLPSGLQLLKASGVAISVAGLLLVTTVLPAEYGVDPTGIGERLGLTRMGKSDKAKATDGNPAALAPSALSAVWRSPREYHSESKTIMLKPNRGAELKARMNVGERFVFSWKVDGGLVSFDMHGDKLDAGKDEFTSFWIDKDQSEGHGGFVAPFDGNHGWYWKNTGTQPVTVTVQVSGYFDKLYRP